MQLGLGLSLTARRRVGTIANAAAGAGFAAASTTVVDGVGSELLPALGDGVSGLATASGAITALIPAVGASTAGVLTADAVGSSVTGGSVGAGADGTATVTAVGESTRAAAGAAADGVATATAVGASAGAGLAIRSTSSLTQAAGRTTSTVPAPAGIQNGDLLLCFFDIATSGNEPSAAVTRPAGWNEAATSPIDFNKSGTYTHGFHVYWKIAASESGNYAFTHVSAETEAFLFCISGAHATTPLSPNPTVNEYAPFNGQTTTALSITTPVNNCLVIMAEVMLDDTIGMVPPSGTTPSFSENYIGGGMYVSSGVMASAGATGDKSHTNGNNGTSNPWGAYLVSVRPA